MKRRFMLQKLTFYGTRPTRFYIRFLLSSRRRVFRPKSVQKYRFRAAPPTRQSEAGQGKDDTKTTAFINVFTTISAGCDSCRRQRADEEGAGEPEPGGREAYGAAGRR
jgi:hypothetical protein